MALSQEAELESLRALEDAEERAYQRHLYSNVPTGVEVRMRCGDAVLFRRYGERI